MVMPRRLRARSHAAVSHRKAGLLPPTLITRAGEQSYSWSPKGCNSRDGTAAKHTVPFQTTPPQSISMYNKCGKDTKITKPLFVTQTDQTLFGLYSSTVSIKHTQYKPCTRLIDTNYWDILVRRVSKSSPSNAPTNPRSQRTS